MASPRAYLDLTLREWLDELARSEGVPGGGSALGFAVASGAAVLAMAARVSGSGGLVAQADALCARTAPLAQVDADDVRGGARGAERERAVEAGAARLGDRPRIRAGGGAAARDRARAARTSRSSPRELAATGDPRVRADALAAAALGGGGRARRAWRSSRSTSRRSTGDPRVAEAEQLAAAAERSASPRTLGPCRSTSTSAWSASRTSRSSSGARSRSPARTAPRRTSRASSPRSPCTAPRRRRAFGGGGGGGGCCGGSCGCGH